MSVILNPFQLLEINVISAQDLAGVSRSMRTYAVAWVNPDRKLSTRVDSRGHNNPTWNDKFVFRVDDDFLRSDTSAITIEIYALNWLNDVHVGTVRVLVGNLIPPPPPVRRPQSNHHYALRVGMRFIALQVRRPSGRPQGILNVGVSLLDSSMRSMPLSTGLSAVGFHDHRPTNKNHHPPHDEEEEEEEPHTPHSKINKYRRSRSERSARVSDLEFNDDQKKKPGSGSTVNESEFSPPTPERGKTGNKKKGKASSIAGGSDSRKGKREGGGRGSSMVSGSSVSVFRVVRRKKKSNNNNKKKKKNGSDVGPESPTNKNNKKTGSFVEPDPPVAKGKKMNGSTVSGSWVYDPPAESIINGSDVGYSPKYRMITDKPIRIHPTSRLVGGGKGGIAEFAPPQRKPNSHNHRQGPNYWTASEVGPSASEVAAAVAEGTYPQDDGRSSVLDKWSLDGSIEGLRSKLERWRTELPPLYDRGSEYAASYPASSVAAGGRRGRRHSAPAAGGGGPFRCIGNIFGYECSCVCGRDASPRKKSGSSQRSSRRVSSSIVSGSYV